MTDQQWNTILRLIRGEAIEPLPVGLFIDSPWLPGWSGISMLDYFNLEPAWLEANLQVVRRFPEIIFYPGFWMEYGMCTEPSAFGSKCIFYEDAFPHAGKTLFDYGQIRHVQKPNCRTDGLLPFVIQRMRRCRPAIEAAGHRMRMVTCRGPMNIACYLLGHTEFMMGIRTNPREIHALMRVVTDFLVDWVNLQAEAVDSIQGVYVLDDLIGFIGEEDFRCFALPYLKAIFDTRPFPVKFLHNDAAGKVTAKFLAEMGVNMFNFSFEHSLGDMRRWAGDSVVLVGNIPPRDILAQGSPEDVRRCVEKTLANLENRRRVLLCGGGGTPPGVPSVNIEALLCG